MSLLCPLRKMKIGKTCDVLWLIYPKTLSSSHVVFQQKISPSPEASSIQPADINSIKRRPKSIIPLVNWFYDDFLKGNIKINSFFTYAEITKQVDYLLFFKTFNMDDTFNSWFLVTELHVWMLLVRLKAAGKDGKTATESLVAALWDDTTSRAKALSPGDSSTSKNQIKTLAREFRATLLIYDEGLLGSDTVLASALWFRLLSQSCDDPRLLEHLTVYVRHQVHNLDNTTAEDILLRSNIKLKPLSVKSGGPAV